MKLEGCIVYQKNYKEPVCIPMGIVVLDKLKGDEKAVLVKLTKDVGLGWSILDSSFDKDLLRQLNEKHVDFEFSKTKFWWFEEYEFTTNKKIFMKDKTFYYIKAKENGLLKNE